MKLGIIGTGNMGTILIESWLESGTVIPADLIITNRTPKKAAALKEKYRGIEVASTAVDIAKKADILFICVKPLQIHSLLQEIKSHLTRDQFVVSITSPISVSQLESELICSCARFIPSITNRALSGVSLLSFGDRCQRKWKAELTKLAEGISKPVAIEENITRVASDIVSCGPAFFSFLAQSFIQAASDTTLIDKKTATILTENMLIGLGDLLSKGFYTLPTLQEKVCVKGGITGEGIKVLEEETGDMFKHLFQATHGKFAEDLGETKKQFRPIY
ncbi:late competence protein ComER [Bacillus massiliglaciei]|uniref:late competence protein ComER n=1 Tax=Bacillus massiliglaciei TaxID=1816693 RepID=UPI000B2D0C60|nr:late competence protein ComER [Bacillus massiliglaciei]